MPTFFGFATSEISKISIVFLIPFVAKILFEPAWKVAISALPSPSPEEIDEISVTLRAASVARAGSYTAKTRADEVKSTWTAKGNFFMY